jgi:O-antigen/teichoic acid export membrane protein
MLAALYHRLEDVWLRLSVGVTAIATAIMPPLIIAWVGDDTGDAPLYAAILTFGYCISTLVSPGAAYLRAVGRPGLEARLGAAVIVSNIVLSVALGIAFGALGVVCATAAAYLVGTAWFLRRVGDLVPPRPASVARPPWLRIAIAALGTAAVAAGFGVLMVAVFPRGVALVPLGAGAVLAFVGYASIATGVRPSPAGLKALLAQ